MGTPAAERMRQMRQRRADERAAALEPVDGPSPLPEADQLGHAVETAIVALGLGPRDAAVAQLARRLAAAIDQAADPAQALKVLGPLFLRVLQSMGGTPADRPAPKQPGRGRPNRVAQLRAEHAKRYGGRGA